jgi:hypothetical protein
MKWSGLHTDISKERKTTSDTGGTETAQAEDG